MIYKYSFSITGDFFSPKGMIDTIEGDFLVKSIWESTDKKFNNSDEEYGYGGILFWHPNKFAIDDNVGEYETWFVDFLEKNYASFIENKVDNFEIYLEIYYTGKECNIEVFNKELLKKIAPHNVSIPLSIYCLEKAYYNDWITEIENSD